MAEELRLLVVIDIQRFYINRNAYRLLSSGRGLMLCPVISVSAQFLLWLSQADPTYGFIFKH